MEMEKESAERISRVREQMEDLGIQDENEARPSTNDEEKKAYTSEEENGVLVDIPVAGDVSNDMQCRSGYAAQGVCLMDLYTEDTSMYFHQVSTSRKSASPEKDMIVPDSAYRSGKSALSRTPEMLDDRKKGPADAKPNCTYSIQNDMIFPDPAYRSGKSAVSPTPEMVDDRKKDADVPKPNCTYSTQNEIIVADSGYISSRSACSSTPEVGYNKMQDAVDAKTCGIENRQGISSEKTRMQVGRKEWGAVVPPIKLNPYEEQLNASSDKGKDVRTICQMSEDEIGIIKGLDLDGRFKDFFKIFRGFEEEDLQKAQYCSYGGQNPALSFLEALRCRRPDLTMQELVEDASNFGRNDLTHFFKTEEISLSCDLNLLADRALSKLALKLCGGIAAPPATATWRDFAFRYGFTTIEMDQIQHSQVKKNKSSPTAELFYMLRCMDPEMTVTEFKSHLFDAGFRNIARGLDLLEQQKLTDTKLKTYKQ